MIVRVKSGDRVVVTQHVLDRYRQRVKQGADAAEVASALTEVEVRLRPPSWAHTKWAATGSQDAWLVTPRWALVLRRPDERDRNRSDIDFVAVTCIAKYKRSKADLRQLREQAREDRWVA